MVKNTFWVCAPGNVSKLTLISRKTKRGYISLPTLQIQMSKGVTITSTVCLVLGKYVFGCQNVHIFDFKPNSLQNLDQGRKEGGARGAHFPGCRIPMGGAKTSNNVTSTFFNTGLPLHLPPTDFRFEHGGAKLAFCLGRHLTSLRPDLDCSAWNLQAKI